MIEAIERMARVMRQSTKSRRKVKPWQQLGHILVATDLSDDSMKAVRFGTKLAKRLGSKLTLMYVYEIPRSLQFMRGRHTMEVIEKVRKIAAVTGPVWHPESFDHIIRSAEQLTQIEKYIQDNPKYLRGKVG